MTDDVTDRARAALEGVTDGPWEVNGFGNINRTPGGEHPPVAKAWRTPDAEFIAASRSLVPELLAEVERLRAGREVERRMLHAGAAEIQDLGFKVEQLQSEQDEDRDEIHTLRRHLADEEAEVGRLRGALQVIVDHSTQWVPAPLVEHLEAVLRGDQ